MWIERRIRGEEQDATETYGGKLQKRKMNKKKKVATFGLSRILIPLPPLSFSL
jgi:hypothetical protein